jgi:hypothetical protein
MLKAIHDYKIKQTSICIIFCMLGVFSFILYWLIGSIYIFNVNIFDVTVFWSIMISGSIACS